MKSGSSKKAAGRPPSLKPKESITVRFDPEQLEKLDAMEKASGINRSGLLQIAVKAMTRIGLAATMKVLE